MKNFLMVMGILVAVGLWIYCGLGSWFLSRDTIAVLDRAQVAANAEDMLGYVNTLEENMSERGMTEGHAAVIFKTPENDMGLIFNTVGRVGERLEEVISKNLSRTDTAYIMSMDDLRGTLRELDLHASGWFWTIRGWWMVLISIFACIVALLAGNWDSVKT